jgi:DNA-binding transcriptional LysR family regulator
MKRATLRQVAVFHAVASGGSIAAAALRLGKSGPAVHHDLKSLERDLGHRLFDRVGRGLRMTGAARRLFEGVSRNLDEIERELARFSRGGGSALRVGTVSGFGRYRLSPLLFRRASAQEIELLMGTHDQILEALVAGRIDVGVTYKPVTAIPIVARPLADEQCMLLGPASMVHPPLTIEALEGLPFVTYDEYEYVFALWFQGVFGRQPGRLRRSDHSSELEEALESVAAGRGVTIAPADAWRQGPWKERCRDLGPDAPAITNALYVLSLAGSPTEAADRILEMFADGTGEV